MASTEFQVVKMKPSGVSLGLTRHLQSIAQEAWTSSLDGVRDPQEIAQAFNPDNPILVTEAQNQYKAFARHGRLVVVAAGAYGPTIGFAMARNDVSPKGLNPIDFTQRTGKRVLSLTHNRWEHPKTNHVRTWIKHIAVKSDAPTGIGTAAIQACLEDFYPDQTSSVYIDDENERSKKFFESFGYTLDTSIDSSKSVYRFGEDNLPTLQRRYLNPVEAVRIATAQRLAELEIIVKER